MKEGNTWHQLDWIDGWMTAGDVPNIEEYQELIIALSDSHQVIV